MSVVRLDNSLQQSLKVTRGDLMQRNIVQGVNVVRRGSRMLEEKVGARPPLEEMVASQRLPPDYIDRAFPEKQEDSVAPVGERIERVSLQNYCSLRTGGLGLAPRLICPAAAAAPYWGQPLQACRPLQVELFLCHHREHS